VAYSVVARWARRHKKSPDDRLLRIVAVEPLVVSAYVLYGAEGGATAIGLALGMVAN